MESCPSNFTILETEVASDEYTSFEELLLSSILALAVIIAIFGTVKVFCFKKHGPKIQEEKHDERLRNQDSLWKNRIKKLKGIFVHIWPKESALQLRILICFLLMIGEFFMILQVTYYFNDISLTTSMI